jgi:putative membrane protein
MLKWIGSAAAIYFTAWMLHPYVDVTSFGRALAVALVLGLLNALVRPVLIVLTLPITVLTLGLFLIVINALMLQLTAWLMEGFNIAHFGWAALAAVIIAAVNLLIDAFFQGLAGRPRR